MKKKTFRKAVLLQEAIHDLAFNVRYVSDVNAFHFKREDLLSEIEEDGKAAVLARLKEELKAKKAEFKKL